jgi:UDP-2,3-diacylglucosamine pyrophosphatase LpxH
VVRFLDEIKDDAAEIFLVGDMFDFWYEYRKVVQKALRGYWESLQSYLMPASDAFFCRQS